MRIFAAQKPGIESMRKRSKKTKAPSAIKQVSPSRKTLVRILFFINAALWLGYAIYIYYDMAVVNQNLTSADVVTLFVFLNSGLMFVSGWQLAKNESWAYYLALIVMGANLLLTLLNILDLFFLGVFLLDLFTLLSLIPIRKIYLSQP